MLMLLLLLLIDPLLLLPLSILHRRSIDTIIDRSLVLLIKLLSFIADADADAAAADRSTAVLLLLLIRNYDELSMLIRIDDQYRRSIDDPYHSTDAAAANKNQKNKRSAPDHFTAAV